MKTITKLARNLTREEYLSCSRLRLREGGRIASDLRYHTRHPHTRARVILVKDEGVVVSWGLIDYTDGPNPVVQLYTRAKYRRRGLGTRVINEAKRILGCNRFVWFAHDDTSEMFFQSQSVKDPRK